MEEGKFYFNELKSHLDEWKAPPFVNIHIDDTRVKSLIEYDSINDKFIGFCLEGAIPNLDMFCFQTFDEIKDAFVKNSKAKYAHCIVAKPLEVLCPSLILCAIEQIQNTIITIFHHAGFTLPNNLKKLELQLYAMELTGHQPS